MKKAKIFISPLIMAIMMFFFFTAVKCNVFAATSQDTMFEYTADGDGITVIQYNGNADEVTIPAVIDGHKVVSVSPLDNFHGIIPSGNTETKKVILADGITSIENGAFLMCVNLESIKLSDSIKSIGKSAFYLCTSLKSITIPQNVTSIGNNAFNGCTSLTEAYFEHLNASSIKLDSDVFANIGTTSGFAVVCEAGAEGFHDSNDFTKWKTYPLKRKGAATPIISKNTPEELGEEQSNQYIKNAVADVLQITAKTVDGGKLSYQWYENNVDDNTGGEPISGATADSYKPSTATFGTTTYYYVKVTNTIQNVVTGGSPTAVETSVPICIEINKADTPIFISNLSKKTFYIQDAQAETLRVSATVSDSGELSYQWYSNSQDNTNGTPISGADTTSYTPPTTTVGTTYYYAVATNTQTGNSITATEVKASNVIKVEIYDPDYPPDDMEGINYIKKDVIITGQSNNSNNSSAYEINLTKETISLPGYKVAAYSIDGGNKWKNIASKPFSNEMLNKLFNKNITLYLSNKAIEKETKKPPETAVIVEFNEINKRPKIGKYVANYAIGADITGETAGTWVLSEKNGTESVKEGIEIASASGKLPDKKGFGKFYGKDGSSNGIPIAPLTSSGKPAKTIYFIRESAKDNGDGTYTAASKAKKISVIGQQKAPKYKVDAKKSLIKYKTNTYISINGSSAVLETSKGECVNESTTVTMSVQMWIGATEKKPASAKSRVMTIPKAKESS